MKAAIVLSLSLACASGAHAADRVIGLLTLPEIFGARPCESLGPAEIRIHSAPDSGSPAGVIRVDSFREFSPRGGCEGQLATVHRAGSVESSRLPTQEYEYEAPAAIVLEQGGRWFRIRLSDGSAWVHASERGEYFSIQRLLTDGLTHLTDAWDRTLAPEPGSAERAPLPADPRRRLAGHLVGQVQRLRIVLQPGQDPDSVRDHHRASAMSSRAGPNGTRILSLETGTVHPLFTAPERGAAVVAEVETNRCGWVLETGRRDRVLVREHRPGWYQVARRADDPRDAELVWLEEGPAWRFQPVANDAEEAALAEEAWGPEHLATRVLGFRELADTLWVEVEVLSDSPCLSIDEPTVRARGWIPAHAPSGEPTIWFSSRGC